MKDRPTKNQTLSASAAVQFLLVLALTILASQELFHNWIFNRTETKSLIFFLIWLLPVIWYQVSLYKLKKTLTFNPFALYACIIITLLGVLGSLNTLCYIGFAVVFAAFLPPNPIVLIWMLTSVIWMPAIGWLALWYFSNYAFLIRLIVVSVSSILTIYILKNSNSRSLTESSFESSPPGKAEPSWEKEGNCYPNEEKNKGLEHE